jgi:hypothetical protein
VLDGITLTIVLQKLHDGYSLDTTDTVMKIFCVTRNRKQLNGAEIYGESIDGKYLSGKCTVGDYVILDVPGTVSITPGYSTSSIRLSLHRVFIACVQ